MKRNYQDWLQTNRMLVAAGISLVVLGFLHVAGISSIWDNANSLLTSLISIAILALAWVMDVTVARRGSSMLPRDMRNEIGDLLEASEKPFLLRVCASPNPLAEHADRFESLIQEAHHWDWTLYTKSPSANINKQILEEINRVYLTAPIETSTFGYITGQWEIPRDYIVVGVVHSTEANQPFVNRPWEISKTSTVKLLPVRVFEYSYVPRGEDWILEDCKVYNSSPAVEEILRRILDKIDALGRRKELWSVGAKHHWAALPLNEIKAKIENEFTGASSTVAFHRLLMPNVRTWLSGQTRGAFAVGFIGYMLSPFSIYNDMFINIPIALVLALLLHTLFSVRTETLVAPMYVATNVLGVMMLAWAFRRLHVRKQYGLTRGQVWLSTLYFAIIFGICVFIGSLASKANAFSSIISKGDSAWHWGARKAAAPK